MDACREYAELISRSLDGALSPEEAAKLEAHLAGCPACRALLEEYRALDTGLAALEEAPPVGLRESILQMAQETSQDAADAGHAFIRPEPEKKRRFAFGPGTAIAAAAAVVLLLIGSGTLQTGSSSSADLEAATAEETASQDDALLQERTVADTAFSAPAGSVSDSEAEAAEEETEADTETAAVTAAKDLPAEEAEAAETDTGTEAAAVNRSADAASLQYDAVQSDAGLDAALDASAFLVRASLQSVTAYGSGLYEYTFLPEEDYAGTLETAADGSFCVYAEESLYTIGQTYYLFLTARTTVKYRSVGVILYLPVQEDLAYRLEGDTVLEAELNSLGTISEQALCTAQDLEDTLQQYVAEHASDLTARASAQLPGQ